MLPAIGIMLDFGALETPRGDGETLIQPPARRLLELLDHNRSLATSYRVRVIDVELSEVRQQTRLELTGSADQVVIVAGHQPEFFHPGVWAKHVVADYLAERLGGRAVNLVVDSDLPKKISLTVPLCSHGHLTTRELLLRRVDRRLTFEQLPELTRHDAERFEAAVAGAMGARFQASFMPVFLAGLAQGCEGEDLVGQMISGRRAIDAAFGIDLVERRVSRVWGGPLLADMILHSRRFMACYNDALAEYRQSMKIRGSTRPIPDLARDGDVVELPLWIHGRDEPRRRLFVQQRGDVIRLLADREPAGEADATALRRWDTAQQSLKNATERRIRPRALALTLWARLALADVFIHGIGGAKYDRITDRLMELYYGVGPPAMMAVSATARLDLPRHNVTMDDLRRFRARQRDFRFNPDRYLPRPDSARNLLLQREQMIERSEFLRAHDPENHRARETTFQAIRDANAAICAREPHIEHELADRVSTAEAQLAHNRKADSREYFVGLFPHARLAELASELRTGVEQATWHDAGSPKAKS